MATRAEQRNPPSRPDPDRATSETPSGSPFDTAVSLGLESELGSFDDQSVVTPAASGASSPARVINPGEVLQCVRYARDPDALRISGVTPHGRKLTFEQREGEDGWYVVAMQQRRRPSERELALVVATITREMEAAMAPEDEREDVRAAYALASRPDQPGMPGLGLAAYRDLLLHEVDDFLAGQAERIAVVAVEYQAFKRFAVRHGHDIGQAFVRALGERLVDLFAGEDRVYVCHKAGKSFRLIARDRSSEQVHALIERFVTDETRRWLVERAWGPEPRTSPSEVHFCIGFATTRASDRTGSTFAVAQRLNDDAFRAAKLGQLERCVAIAHAKNAYRTTVHQWGRRSEEQIESLASQMDEGPADVMAEMNDYLHELTPANLDRMAVEGDVEALLHAAIARDGFWQGSVAMRIAGERLLRRFRAHEPAPPGENDYVGGFELGDEFYGMVREHGRFYLAWGDINSAGATRLRAGLHRIRQAVGWRRSDGGGIVGRFLGALKSEGDDRPFPLRVREAAEKAYADVCADPAMRVNDGVEIGEYLQNPDGSRPTTRDHLAEGEEFQLVLPGRRHRVRVLDRRSRFGLKLEIDGREHLAALTETEAGLLVKLRIRDAVVSAAVCVLEVERGHLEAVLARVREDHGLREDRPLDVLGFLRHVADLLLAVQVKGPGKVGLALGEPYQGTRFVQHITLDEARHREPGLFFEAVHRQLLGRGEVGMHGSLEEMIGRTMLARPRPGDRGAERPGWPAPGPQGL